MSQKNMLGGEEEELSIPALLVSRLGENEANGRGMRRGIPASLWFTGQLGERKITHAFARKGIRKEKHFTRGKNRKGASGDL